MPDQIYLDTKPLGWLQPFAFMAPWLARTESDIQCQLPIHIAAGHPVRVEFHDSGYVRSLDDGSQLFTREVVGPRGLPLLATGDAYFSDHMMPALDLFHHTTDDAKAKFTASGWLRGSQWNIQGTHDKQLANVAYAYLTSWTGSVRTWICGHSGAG